ncbi:hypothetical protein BJX61DRAFT_551919 [Aspergillus egyptiacus]|nr:hypothetical protein BJX61DRAFT_551919 [Aspergillus egyptiacus]
MDSKKRLQEAAERKRERDKESQRQERLDAGGCAADTDLSHPGYTYAAACSSALWSAPASRPSTALVVSSALLETLLDSPVWLRLPLFSAKQQDPHYLLSGASLTPLISQLRATPDLAASCLDLPKPIDLLFGGSSNPLANTVASELRDLPILAPEKFATSWVSYLYCRWLIWPSSETFDHLPAHLRPTTIQLVQEHPLAVDVVLWPQMRDNLILHGAKYDLGSVFGLLACTCRVRGGFNQELFIRENDGDPEVHPDFYQRFMNPGQWGLLEKFWTEYPELVQGLDPAVMLRAEYLLPS